MIQNNKFFLKNFKNVVFLGQSEIFEKLIDANSSIGLNTFLVTSSDQAKNISSSLNPISLIRLMIILKNLLQRIVQQKKLYSFLWVQDIYLKKIQ